eukprot:scaffold77288_cov19-Tisochrysis_lutea.AAC.1
MSMARRLGKTGILQCKVASEWGRQRISESEGETGTELEAHSCSLGGGNLPLSDSQGRNTPKLFVAVPYARDKYCLARSKAACLLRPQPTILLSFCCGTHIAPELVEQRQESTKLRLKAGRHEHLYNRASEHYMGPQCTHQIGDPCSPCRQVPVSQGGLTCQSMNICLQQCQRSHEQGRADGQGAKERCVPEDIVCRNRLPLKPSLRDPYLVPWEYTTSESLAQRVEHVSKKPVKATLTLSRAYFYKCSTLFTRPTHQLSFQSGLNIPASCRGTLTHLARAPPFNLHNSACMHAQTCPSAPNAKKCCRRWCAVLLPVHSREDGELADLEGRQQLERHEGGQHLHGAQAPQVACQGRHGLECVHILARLHEPVGL